MFEESKGKAIKGGAMAKKKVYAVKKGSQTGIFYTWDACKSAVSGYPGAEYKGFLTEEEAWEYLGGKPAGQEPEREPIPAGKVIAYVDGSFDKEVGRYSFGCVLLTPEGEIFRESGNGDNPESAALRNVTGEMLGAMSAVQWAIKRGYVSIEIRYDYMGIEKWVTKEWKAKTSLTQKYADYMERCAGRISISFQKVAAHTGDYYNEEADKLAKQAIRDGVL